jgi:hypothetical protein
MASFTFDAAAVPLEETSYELIKEGSHPMIIFDTEPHRNEEKKSEGIKVQYKITGGPNEGRIIYDFINTVNANPKAVEIGQQTMGQICRALSLPGFEDTAELHNKAFRGFVKHKMNKGKEEIEARVVGFDPAKIAVSAAPAEDDADCPPF